MLPKQARRAILQYELWYDLLKLFGGENDLHIYLTCHIRLKMEKFNSKKVSKMLILAIETILYCVLLYFNLHFFCGYYSNVYVLRYITYMMHPTKKTFIKAVHISCVYYIQTPYLDLQSWDNTFT